RPAERDRPGRERRRNPGRRRAEQARSAGKPAVGRAWRTLPAGGFPVSSPVPMVDLHAHILPGTDDGADTLEDAVEMCRQAAAGGTDTIAAKPHRVSRVRV